jgi:hypothetical protein
MHRRPTRDAFVLRVALVATAFATAHGQAGTTLSAKVLWRTLALPQPKYAIGEWGASSGWQWGWIDPEQQKLTPGRPEATIQQITANTVWSPKGDEAFDRDTTADLVMQIYEYKTTADAETAWKNNFDESYVRRPRGPSSDESVGTLNKRISKLGQPSGPAERQRMVERGEEIPPPGTIIQHLKTSHKREEIKLGLVKDESYTAPEGDAWQIVNVQDGLKRRRVVRETWSPTVIKRTVLTEREQKVKDGETGEVKRIQYVYEKRISHRLGPNVKVARREYEFFLIENCVVIAQWHELIGERGARKAYTPEWDEKILPLLEKLCGGRLPVAEERDAGEERVETLHVHAEGYRPAKVRVKLPASADGWKVTGTIADGKAGVPNAVLRWDGSKTTTRAGAKGLFVKPFGKQGADPRIVVQDVRLSRSPTIEMAVREADVTHPFLPFPTQGDSRTVRLVFAAGSDPSLAGHRGVITFRNASRLPFARIDRAPQELDKAGTWSVPVTMRRLQPTETLSLRDMPMAAEFEVAVEKPDWHEPVAKASFTVPLGAFIVMGSTVGPDYRKRYTPVAPVAITALHLAYPERAKAGKVRNVHLLGQVNPQGDFWTLVRAPERGDSTEYLLQWSNLCKVPLLLQVGGRGGYKPAMIGRRLPLTCGRARGNVDLLSPEEHEARTRDLMVGFVQQMPLKSGPRGRLVTQVKNIRFTYDGASTRPHWNGSAIVLPGEKRKLWGEEPYGRIAKGERAMYVLAFHEMGHALHELAVEKLGRIAWVRKLTYGAAAHATWEPARVTLPMPTVSVPGLSWKVRRKAVAFTEATAEFFAWCMYDYLAKEHADTFGKSLYFDRDYLAQFDTDRLALAACHHGGFQVEGVQVTFLRALYAGVPAPRACGDFLRTMALYQNEHFFLRWVPARAIDEWVAMKLKHGGLGGDVKALSSKFNIVGGPAIFLQVAKDGFVRVNGKVVHMQADQIQFQRLVVGDKVVIDRGHYVVSFTATSSREGVLDHVRLGALAVGKRCEFEITGPFEVRLTKGRFASGGVNTATPVGIIRHKQTSYIVEIGHDGATAVQVVEGCVEVETARGATEVREGKAVYVSRAGEVRHLPPRDRQKLLRAYDPTDPEPTEPPLLTLPPVASDLLEHTAKPTQDPPKPLAPLVQHEMTAIKAMLPEGDARAAVTRILGLFRLWKEHQRGQWGVLLGWVHGCRKEFPAVDGAGRHRLNVLEEDLQRLITEEAEWRKVRAKAEQTEDLAARRRMLEAYIRTHIDGFYCRDAEQLMARPRRGPRPRR